MEVGIYGLPFSGKSTLFDLLTGHGEAHDPTKTRVGSVAVPDNRLEQLAKWYHSKKTTPVHLDFHDPGIGSGTHEKSSDSLSNARLNPIRHLDTILLVVRCFYSDRVPHPEGSIHPARDIDLLLTQLVVADLEVVSGRLHRIKEGFQKLPKEAREPVEKERDALLKISKVLESKNPWEPVELSESEKKTLRSYSLFHLKRFIVVANLGDLSSAPDRNAWESLIAESQRMRFPIVGVNADLEKELSGMAPEEAADYRNSMSLEPESKDVLLRTICECLGMVTFYTVVSHEASSRMVPVGCPAPKAAGAIHSDMEKGFIRMEVMSFNDLFAAEGSEFKVKQAGGYRVEGKDYIVQDGDVVVIRFST